MLLKTETEMEKELLSEGEKGGKEGRRKKI